MQAELNGLYTITHDDLREVRPENAAFCIDVRALVGAVGTGGEESFDFEVCSPAWLEQELENDHVVSGRYRLVMKDFNYPLLERYVRNRIAQASGKDWDEVAAKLAGWSKWEFADYSE
jgi:Immunity protein 8